MSAGTRREAAHHVHAALAEVLDALMRLAGDEHAEERARLERIEDELRALWRELERAKATSDERTSGHTPLEAPRACACGRAEVGEIEGLPGNGPRTVRPLLEHGATECRQREPASASPWSDSIDWGSREAVRELVVELIAGDKWTADAAQVVATCAEGAGLGLDEVFAIIEEAERAHA
jgi:hypothetical protein